MCGRYYIDDEITEEILRTFPGVDNRLPQQTGTRDVYPHDTAPVIATLGNRMILEEQRWGFPEPGGKTQVINARAETVWDKRMFRNGIRYHRVAIPARHFYEWNALKEKSTFQRRDDMLLYMAGFGDLFENEIRFVILTTQANDSMVKIHDRMPLILESEQIGDWLRNDRATDQILRQTPVMLSRYAEYEQLSLFDL